VLRSRAREKRLSTAALRAPEEKDLLCVKS
jgi:hypothetical protein